MSCDFLFLPIKFFIFNLVICALHFTLLYFTTSIASTPQFSHPPFPSLPFTPTHYSISHSLFTFSSRLNSKPHPLSHPYYHHFFFIMNITIIIIVFLNLIVLNSIQTHKKINKYLKSYNIQQQL